MILVTGGTGFIGQHLIRRLVTEGREVRTLIRPSPRSPQLPPGVAVQAAISSLHDERGLRAALVGVDTVFHLAGVNMSDAGADPHETEVQGTRELLEAAQDAGVRHILFVSHLGADRAAAYPLLKAKGIAEERIRNSGIPYTILRSGLVFGPRDHFTTTLARLMAISPGIFPVPGDGHALVQPIWVDDLVSALVWSLEEESLRNKLFEVGGPEHLSIEEVMQRVNRVAGLHRRLLNARPSYLRIFNNALNYLAPRLPVSNYWLDYLASSRVCELESMPRSFGLMPARFSQQLAHLEGVNWRQDALGEFFGRFAGQT